MVLFFFLFDKAFLFFVASSNTWSLLNCFMLSRINRWLNWTYLMETMLNSSHDLTFKRPEPDFQFHHRFCLWGDYLLVLHFSSPFFKGGDQDSCSVCGDGLKTNKQTNSPWYLSSERQAPTRCKLGNKRASWPLFLWDPEVRNEYASRQFLLSTLPSPFASEKPEAAGFPQRRKSMWLTCCPCLTLNIRRLRLSGICNNNW